MDPRESSQLLAAIHALGPRRFLEWGAGGTTRELLQRSTTIEEYVSVEHDPTWFRVVRDAVGDPRLTIYLAEPDVALAENAGEAERWGFALRGERDPEVFKTYVGLPRTLGGTFDFVLVDGRARRFCIEEGYSLLRPGGVLALHDAQRPDYQGAIRALGEPLFLEPWLSGQLGLLRKPA
jgi:SAM-dependent methyltransferase